MRGFLSGAILLVAASTLATVPAAATERHVFEILGGMKWMSDDWKNDAVDLSNPIEIGIRWVSPLIRGPLDLESGYAYSWARDEVGPIDLKADISRIHVGARYGLPGNWVLLHVVGGVQWVDAALEADVERSGDVLRDSALGLYTGAGGSVPLTESWRVGADFRYSWTTLEFEGEDVDAGGLHLAGLVGIAW